MSKISKLLVMALVILAVITMSVRVNAGQSSLIDYVTTSHSINGMFFELPDKDKESVKNYLTTVSDAEADSALSKIKAAEDMLRNSGATRLENLSKEQKANAISLAQQAAVAVGLELKVNTDSNTYQLLKGGRQIAGGSVSSAVQYPSGGGAAGSGNGSGAASTSSPVGRTYLYTGASYVAFSAIVLAIVAVAVVVKKRA